MEIYLDSFPIPLGTDTFILTTLHSPDLAYSAMATQLSGTCAVFSPRLCVYDVSLLLCSPSPLVEEQPLNSAQVQEGFAPATHPFSQCCQGFWAKISAQLVEDSRFSEHERSPCNMDGVLLHADASTSSRQSAAGLRSMAAPASPGQTQGGTMGNAG